MLRKQVLDLAKSLDSTLKIPEKVIQEAQRFKVTNLELLHAHIELAAGICDFNDSDDEKWNDQELTKDHNGTLYDTNY